MVHLPGKRLRQFNRLIVFHFVSQAFPNAPRAGA